MDYFHKYNINENSMSSYKDYKSLYYKYKKKYINLKNKLTGGEINPVQDIEECKDDPRCQELYKIFCGKVIGCLSEEGHNVFTHLCHAIIQGKRFEKLDQEIRYFIEGPKTTNTEEVKKFINDNSRLGGKFRKSEPEICSNKIKYLAKK